MRRSTIFVGLTAADMMVSLPHLRRQDSWVLAVIQILLSVISRIMPRLFVFLKLKH